MPSANTLRDGAGGVLDRAGAGDGREQRPVVAAVQARGRSRVRVFMFAIGARDRASSRLRVWDHVGALRDKGHEVTVDSLTGPAKDTTKLGLALRTLRCLPGRVGAFLRADAVLIQETLLLWPLVLMKNFGKRRRLVFDFSDPIDRVGKGAKRRLRRAMFGAVVRRSDDVVVENRAYLRTLEGHGRRLHHFYGPVDAVRYGAGRDAALQSPRASDALRIGWAGSLGTYKFVAPLMPIIDELARDRQIEVLLFGIPKLDLELNNARLKVVPWDEEAEFATIPTFDLGLFRLEDNEDAQWRGAGKLFTYMAAGVPFVASDLGIAHGLMREAAVGFPVAHDRDWPAVLREALDDGERRRAMAERSLAFARDHLSYEVYREALFAHLGAGAAERMQVGA